MIKKLIELFRSVKYTVSAVTIFILSRFTVICSSLMKI